MPIVNGKYESPIWENNQPPAMDAAEMQAITDSVEESIHALGDYTTPAQKMGLTGDLSVGASLGVLANIGNVHVWRKTVITEEEIPAGYTLGPVESNKVLAQSSSNWGNSYAAFTVASSITVDDGGNVTMNDTSGVEIWQGYFDPNKGEDNLLGKFIQFSHVSADHISSDLETGVYFIPSNAAFIRDHSSAPFYTKISACQKVNAYPLTPAGTHITYLTSVNRNAYQEGNDEVPAKYMLGDIHSGDSVLVEWGWVKYKYSNEVKISGDSLVLASPSTITIHAGPNPVDPSEAAEVLPGKYIEIEDGGSGGDLGFEEHTIYFIPTDAEITTAPADTGAGAAGSMVITKKYQDVLLIPAIPAGTIIEYLGVLGDKIRMQIVSYIGTGTSGEATPCSITADFKFKTAEFLGYLQGTSFWPSITNNDFRDKVLSEAITTSFTAYSGFCLGDAQFTYGKKSADGKTITWYNQYNNKQSQQLNENGTKYFFRFFE